MIWRLAVVLALALNVSSVPGTPQVSDAGDDSALPAIPLVTGDSLVSFESDSQSPLFFETLFIRPNNNDSAREMIYRNIVADRPNGIFHLGDMISMGGDLTTWKSTDIFLNRASRAHIPVFATLGNHELIFWPIRGLQQFYDRFPWYRKTGYAVRVGKLAVVLLNSNFGQLEEREQAEQLSWLDSTLVAYESDTTVGAVFVCCHHPPYTNSTIVSPSKKVQDSFVPPYLRHPKCRLFISGHCHAFEHFRQGGKDFFVIGGGGGLQQPLLTGLDRRWDDLFPQKTEKRMFHYLRCRLNAQGVELTVRMVKQDFSGFEDVYTLSLPYVQTIR